MKDLQSFLYESFRALAFRCSRWIRQPCWSLQHFWCQGLGDYPYPDMLGETPNRDPCSKDLVDLTIRHFVVCGQPLDRFSQGPNGFRVDEITTSMDGCRIL